MHRGCTYPYVHTAKRPPTAQPWAHQKLFQLRRVSYLAPITPDSDMEYESPIAEYDKVLGEFIPSEPKDGDEDGGPDADGSNAPKPSWKAEVKMVMQLTDHEGKSDLVAFESY